MNAYNNTHDLQAARDYREWRKRYNSRSIVNDLILTVGFLIACCIPLFIIWLLAGPK